MAGKGDRNRSIGKSFTQSSFWVLKDREWCPCKQYKVEYELHNKNAADADPMKPMRKQICLVCYDELKESDKVLYKLIQTNTLTNHDR